LIEELINELNLGTQVILPGYQKNPYPWIANAKLLVLSSDFEGFGRVLAESLILNTPAISTDCPSGPAEILAGPLQMFLSLPEDSNALATNILKALKDYPDLSTLDFSNFDAKHIAKEFLELAKIIKETQ